MTQSIRDVMTANPRTCEVDATVADAAAAMRDTDAGAVIVTRDGEVCGLVTDRDIVVRAVAKARDPETTKLEEIATTDIEALSPEDSVEDAIRIVRDHKVRRVPVVEDGQPVGIVSIGDLALERDQVSALAELSGAPSNN